MKAYSAYLKLLLLVFLQSYVLTSNAQTTFIPYGSVWKYWANTQANYPANWQTTGFNDSGWPSGPGELGYGDGDEATCIPSSTSPVSCSPTGAKWPSYYFRYAVSIANPALYTNFTFNVERDDGFVLYINGTEYYRDNIAAGAVTYATSATSAVEDAVISFTVPNTAFTAGTNIIAVEVHQASVSGTPPTSNSSDISFNLQLLGNDGFSSNLTRGPYLQVGTTDGITIRWRTSSAQNSKIELGTTYGSYTIVVSDAASVTEHVVRVNGLLTDTKYYYRIGNSTNMQAPDPVQFFTTLPPANTTRKIRIAAFGDCGRNNATYQDQNLTNYRNYLTTNGIDAPDAWILMGDNAYNSGTDAEFTSNFFNIYGANILRNHKLYPAPGNHDYGNNSGNKTLRSMPYHTNFTVPQSGECGGVASNKQNYYSFDIGNIHFLSLDSYGIEPDGTDMQSSTNSALKTWLTNDLAANTKKWVIAYWHHPPYTKSSHNSDAEADLVNIRQNFITFLETRGVDMIVCGHSHAYERGYLLRNFTGAWTAFNAPTHAVSTSSAAYTSNTTCPYVYNTSPLNHGTVYVVAGSAGASGGTNTGFGAYEMPYAVNDAGIFYFEVEDNRLDAKMLRRDGTIFDRFTIMKDVNKSTTINATINNPVNLTASWPAANYNWNTGGTGRTISFTPTTTGTTNFTVTDAFGCVTDNFTVNATGTLPVQIQSYEARLVNKKVEINWATASETDNAYFTIERSADARTYFVTGTVNGSGNTNDLRSYSFTDPLPLAGISYYRLSQTNIDGRQSYIGVKRIDNFEVKDFQVTAIAGIAGRLSLQINVPQDGAYTISVIDISGHKVYSQAIRLSHGLNRREINLKPGVYIWEVKNGKGQNVTREALIR